MLEDYILKQLQIYRHICISDITIENIINYINNVCRKLDRRLVKVEDSQDVLFLEERRHILYISGSSIFNEENIDLSKFYIIADNPLLRQLNNIKFHIVECRKLFLIEQFSKK